MAFVIKDDDICAGKSHYYKSIQAAINTEGTGSVIHIAQGSYDEAITLSNSISSILKGGWDTTFTSQTARKTFIKSPKVFQGSSITLQMLNIVPE